MAKERLSNEEILSDIAAEYKNWYLRVVDTTRDAGGYPRGTDCALTGFDTPEQAEEIVRKYGAKYGLVEVDLKKRDGWHFWHVENTYRRGRGIYGYTPEEAFGEDNDLYENDASTIAWLEEQKAESMSYYEQQFEDMDEEDREEALAEASRREDIKIDAVKALKDDEVLVWDFTDNREECVMNKHAMEYRWDVYAVAKGLMIDEDFEEDEDEEDEEEVAESYPAERYYWSKDEFNAHFDR